MTGLRAIIWLIESGFASTDTTHASAVSPCGIAPAKHGSVGPTPLDHPGRREPPTDVGGTAPVLTVSRTASCASHLFPAHVPSRKLVPGRQQDQSIFA